MIAMRCLSKVLKLPSRFAKSKKFLLKSDVSERRKRSLANEVSLSAVEEIKRYMLEVINRFRSEAEKRFSEICMLNKVFGFLNPHALLRSENIEEDMNKLTYMLMTLIFLH